MGQIANQMALELFFKIKERIKEKKKQKQDNKNNGSKKQTIPVWRIEKNGIYLLRHINY